MKWAAIILAGGESRRMGRDKAWIEVGGKSLIVRAILTAQEAGAAEVYVSGRAGVDYTQLGVPVLLDLHPGLGPLGGIERGLRQATAPLLLVLAVDLARMQPAYLQSLWMHCDGLTGVVPKRRGRLEPLAAFYPHRCHAIASSLISRCRYAAQEFALACHQERAVRFLTVPAASEGFFANWNAPADLPESGP